MRVLRNSWLSTGDPDEPDELLMVSASPDPRCLNIVEQASQGYRTKRAIVLRFLTDSPPSQLASDSAQRLSTILESKLVDGSQVHVTLSPREDVSIALDDIGDFLGGDVIRGTITLDISTFMRPYIFGTIYFLRRRFPFASLRIVYAPRWVGYRTRTVPRLSGDVRSVFPIQYFNNLKGSSDGEKRLLLFLGFESHRALAIWQGVEVQGTVPFVGFTGSDGSGFQTSIRANRVLLEAIRRDNGREPIVHNSWQPSDVIRGLFVEMARGNQNTVFQIAPLGPKVEAAALASALRLVDTPGFQVLYASVERGQPPKFADTQPEYPLLEFRVQDVENEAITMMREIGGIRPRMENEALLAGR